MEKGEESPRIFIPEHWSEASNLIARSSCSSSPPIIFICGPKNSGKSTFSRFLLNQLIARYKNVAYLDTDVGQPTFTIPGCLSLHVVDEQIPSLSVLCLKTPERCVFFGDVSSKRDPGAYLDGFFCLYDYYRSKCHLLSEKGNPGSSLLPLIINTPGWVKGVGYEIIVKMLRYVESSHVVQICISVEEKNLPKGAFWCSREKETARLIDLDTVFHDASNRSVLIQKDGHSLRDARVLAYFRQCFGDNSNITTKKELAYALISHCPYEVPLSLIKVRHLHCTVPGNEIFHSLNATIVGLAVDSKPGKEPDSCGPWCIGFALVRGVDTSKRLLYLITPVPQCHLDKVTTLLQCFIQIPKCLLQVDGYVSPYMSTFVLPVADPR